MGEPTIYKPSIYKGNGIYKNGASGGGGIVYDETTINGKKYTTVKINGVEYLAQNLDDKFNGEISFNTAGNVNIPCCWYYSGLSAETSLYDGLIYNGLAAYYIEANKERLIPGWHVPTKDELDNLALFCMSEFGLVDEPLKSNYRWGTVGTNLSGFNALPSGARQPNGNWLGYNARCIFLSCTPATSDQTFQLSLYNTEQWTIGGRFETFGGSIRLIKD